MSDYQTETQIFREGLFRFGQWFTLLNLKYSYYRDPIAKLICVNVVDDALRKGWTLVKPGTEEKVEWNNKAQKHIKNYLPELLQSFYFARRDGEALLGAFEHEGMFIVRAFPAGDFRLTYNDDGSIEGGSAWSRYKNHLTMPEHVINENNRHRFTKVILKRRDRQNEGLSELENVWDVLFAIQMLISHSAYFVARAGGGKKTVIIPESELDEAGSLMTTLLTTAAHFGSAHDVAFVPATINGMPVEFNVQTVDNPTDFNAYFEMYVSMISSGTGIPANIIKGVIAPGEKEGAVVAEESYFDVLRDIQYLTENYNRWFMYQLNDQYNFASDLKIDGDEPFDFLYATRQVMSQAEEIELLIKKAEAVKVLMDARLKPEKAFKLAKFAGITAADLEEKQELPMLPPANNKPVGGSDKGRPFPPTKPESKLENQPQLVAKK